MKEFGSSPAPQAESGNEKAACPPLSTSTKCGQSLCPATHSHSCHSGLKVVQSLHAAPSATHWPVTKCHCPPAVQYSTTSEKSLASESGDGRVKLEHRPLEQLCTLYAVLRVQVLVHHGPTSERLDPPGILLIPSILLPSCFERHGLFSGYIPPVITSSTSGRVRQAAIFPLDYDMF